jgi:mono/diheme cytochrome c family protein
MRLPLPALLVCGLLFQAVSLTGEGVCLAAQPTAEERFAFRVSGILKEKCFSCHGDDASDVRGQLDARSLAGLLQGGESGEASLVPGRPDESPLLLAAQRTSDVWSPMPPKENDRLTNEQIADLREWIAAGAPWPDDDRLVELQKRKDPWGATAGVTVVTSGGLADEWTGRGYDPANLWAYQPLRTEFPQLSSPSPARSDRGARPGDDAPQEHENPIDRFIDQALAETGLRAAVPSDRRTLLRRVTLDLIGLPPTGDEVEAFVNDPADDDTAFAKVVERLLASPHYGEQWGRHWLDVVRYADSSGYANDFERGNAWRYRDYVVRAFNDDKPYDQFVREQLAGDELDDSDPEKLVGVGFLRMGPWELTGMEVAKVARQRFLDDVTDAVGQVFLGHLLQCARCHDHKFDPVPTRDYYSIQAAFATTQLAERAAPFLDVENTRGFDERRYLLARKEFYERALRELDDKQTLAAAREWLVDNRRDATPFEAAVGELESDGQSGPVTVAAVRTLMQRRKVDPELIPPRHVGFEPRDFGVERVSRKGLERLEWRLDRYEPFALSVYSGRTPELKAVLSPQRMPGNRMDAGILEETCILVGGDPFSPSQPVTPGVLSVVGHFANVDEGTRAAHGVKSGNSADRAADPLRSAAEDDGPVPGVGSGNDAALDIAGRRLALARWITSTENPLTSRVMVNRIWQWHFGLPLAGNPNNFGATGKKPTHPELLDWLAGTFVQRGWSVKEIHRLILMSRAYRRSTEHPDPAQLAELDPLGTSYARFRPRRLDAEELRDAMLFVSGELNRELGGIPVCPEMNPEAAMQPRQVMGTFAEAWQPSPLPAQRHRRSLYALRIRGQRDPFQEVFNAPTPDISCESREASTVTPQVFALFNSAATFDRALALAARLLQKGTSRDETINLVFREVLGRTPTPDERTACLAHWQSMTARHESLQFAAVEYPTEILREAVEESTGEKFEFAEPLEVYTEFVPDLKPADVTPEVRGLAEVCLVMLNSNEFAYVY